MKQDLKQWYRVSEAAEFMGVSGRTIRDFVHTNKLAAKIVHGKLWLIQRSELEKHMKRLPTFKGYNLKAI